MLDFRGQFEQLESRTVLSASIGTPPVHFDAPPIGVIESVYANGSVAMRRDSAAPIAWAASLNEPYGHRQSTLASPPPLAGPLVGLAWGQTFVLRVIVIHIPLVNSSVDNLESPHSSLGANEFKPPVAATSPAAGGMQNQPASKPTQFAQAPADSTPPLAVRLTTPQIPTDEVQVDAAVRTSSGVRDTVFRQYSSNTLLLASGLREFGGTGTRRLDDELATAVDRDKSDFVNLDDASPFDDFANSLDALQREREAVDAVLSELHDLDLRLEERTLDAAPPDEPPYSATESDNIHEQQTRVEKAPNLSSTDAAGGMVLLEVLGDANLCDFDLTNVLTGDLERGSMAPLGIEVSVGIYQAFDVGASQPAESH
jgi:hypothetical protein